MQQGQVGQPSSGSVSIQGSIHARRCNGACFSSCMQPTASEEKGCHDNVCSCRGADGPSILGPHESGVSVQGFSDKVKVYT
jgi:hypothetical protein